MNNKDRKEDLRKPGLFKRLILFPAVFILVIGRFNKDFAPGDSFEFKEDVGLYLDASADKVIPITEDVPIYDPIRKQKWRLGVLRHNVSEDSRRAFLQKLKERGLGRSISVSRMPMLASRRP